MDGICTEMEKNTTCTDILQKPVKYQFQGIEVRN